MANYDDFFPNKIATGDAFCNRKNELGFLNENINLCRNIVIYSPRRYGKTSLVMKSVEDANVIYCCIDLFLAHDEAMISKRILKGISTIISQLEKPTEKFVTYVKGLFKNFKVSVNFQEIQIEGAFLERPSDHVDLIFDSLSILDEITRDKNKKVVMFFDEFQDISNAASSKSIQGAIRNIAQSSKNIVFIFSGSYRHLLAEMFDDKTMPLYMSCDKLYLERIKSEEYKLHINRFSLKKWNVELNEIALEQILKLTECHAFYINMLCNALFKYDKIPTRDEINAVWNNCVESEKRRFISDLDGLTVNQQDILRLTAVYEPKEPQGSNFLLKSKKSSTTVRQCIEVLIKKDFIYRVESIDEGMKWIELGSIRVLDPLFATFLRKLS